MAERVRWENARPGESPREVLVEFRHSPDYEPADGIRAGVAHHLDPDRDWRGRL